MESGGALAALEAMKAHPKEAGVQVGTEEKERQKPSMQVKGQVETLQVPVPIPTWSKPCRFLFLPSSYSSAATCHPPRVFYICFFTLCLIFPYRLFIGIWGGGRDGGKQMGLCWDLGWICLPHWGVFRAELYMEPCIHCGLKPMLFLHSLVLPSLNMHPSTGPLHDP